MGIFKVYIDGACLGNPGKAGIGVVFYNEKNQQICEMSHYLGDATNNIAEYQSLIAALKKALEIGLDNLFIYTDSELLARQINGFYKVRNEELKQLYSKAKKLIANFESVRIFHISREKNKYADKLAQQAVQQSTV
ncbi:ribonuclease H [Candidatus Desantisbacteria bacterium CG07_land_8_20_14_0_80_39_15]|uniref:Ribonuclease H n=1 Tax=Candidatus Desantisbacteria bacterium CG07_land_8_20_14_0_80_39_15 TaxID=1974549 RepID=A0A2M6ZG27_9BACT|nr:MAG: ribonuclease H [Candidatus Desantisbacteria bacterium CG07_land_8_20_14_0_80_39_15]